MKINVLALQIMSSNKRKILMEAFIESHLITVFKYGCFTPESAIIRLPLSKKEHYGLFILTISHPSKVFLNKDKSFSIHEIKHLFNINV